VATKLDVGNGQDLDILHGKTRSRFCGQSSADGRSYLKQKDHGIARDQIEREIIS
jgi:hypothetical protein